MIVELKCVEAIKNIHIAQVMTYLKAEKLRVGLLFNFIFDKLKEGIRRVRLVRGGYFYTTQFSQQNP